MSSIVLALVLAVADADLVSRRLEIMSAVDYGREDSSVVAPELFITSPDGRTSGFDKAPGTAREALPDSGYFADTSSEDSEDASDTGGPRTLWLRPPDEATYALEVIGTTTGHYGLVVTAYVASGAGPRAEARRSLSDVPMLAGAVHHYRVEYARERDETVRLRIVAMDAPAPQPAQPSGAADDMGRPAFTVETGPSCGGRPLMPARLTTPGGRSVEADLESRGPSVGLSPLRAEEYSDGDHSFRLLTASDPSDGEYVVEIFSAATPTPYWLQVSFESPGTHYELSPGVADCSRMIVAPGAVHRWVFRIAQHSSTPLRMVRGPDLRRPPGDATKCGAGINEPAR